jgi:hypothetical protein
MSSSPPSRQKLALYLLAFKSKRRVLGIGRKSGCIEEWGQIAIVTHRASWHADSRIPGVLPPNRKLLLDQQMSEVFRRGVRITNDKLASVQRSAGGRVFDCEFVAYPQFRSTFLRTRRNIAKVSPTITVNRYASQNINLSFECWMPLVASPISAQPESAHKQENAGQDPTADTAPE